MPTSLKQDLLRLRKLKRSYNLTKAAAENAEREFKKQQAAVLVRMEQEGVESMKVDGTNFVPVKTVYATVQDRDAFVEWAKEHDDSLVEFKERQQLTNQLVRELLDNGQGFPPGLGFYEREYIRQGAA